MRLPWQPLKGRWFTKVFEPGLENRFLVLKNYGNIFWLNFDFLWRFFFFPKVFNEVFFESNFPSFVWMTVWKKKFHFCNFFRLTWSWGPCSRLIVSIYFFQNDPLDGVTRLKCFSLYILVNLVENSATDFFLVSPSTTISSHFKKKGMQHFSTSSPGKHWKAALPNPVPLTTKALVGWQWGTSCSLFIS